MESRFEIFDEEYIEELKVKSKNENTKNSMEWWKKVFKKWANERNLQANLEEYENDVLDQRLSQFWAFRNSVMLPSMLLTSNRNGSQNYGLISLVFSDFNLWILQDSGNFNNVWKHKWY